MRNQPPPRLDIPPAEGDQVLAPSRSLNTRRDRRRLESNDGRPARDVGDTRSPSPSKNAQNAAARRQLSQQSPTKGPTNSLEGLESPRVARLARRRLDQSYAPSEVGSARSRRGPGSMRGPVRSSSRGSFSDAGSSKWDQGVAGRPVRRVGKAEVNIIGEIDGASGFKRDALFCRWQLVYDPTKSWAVVQGLEQGATQACTIMIPETNRVVWAHPLSVQLTTQSLQGWPSILFMVYHRDPGSNKDYFVSYGLCPLPTQPGMHSLSCQTWFALERKKAIGRTLLEWFIGLTPRLEDERFVTDVVSRARAGQFVCSIGAGQVHLRIQILLKGTQFLYHESGESLYRSLENIQSSIEVNRRKHLDRMNAIEDIQQQKKESEGLKQIRQRRGERFADAAKALDSRRQSVDGSEGGRSRSADPRASHSGSISGLPRDTQTSRSAPRDRTSNSGRRAERVSFSGDIPTSARGGREAGGNLPRSRDGLGIDSGLSRQQQGDADINASPGGAGISASPVGQRSPTGRQARPAPGGWIAGAKSGSPITKEPYQCKPSRAGLKCRHRG
eukprot:gene26061-11763_t